MQSRPLLKIKSLSLSTQVFRVYGGKVNKGEEQYDGITVPRPLCTRYRIWSLGCLDSNDKEPLFVDPFVVVFLLFGREISSRVVSQSKSEGRLRLGPCRGSLLPFSYETHIPSPRLRTSPLTSSRFLVRSDLWIS